VKGVDRRELDKYPDVVIVSTQGKRSLASMLADGGAFATFFYMHFFKTLLRLLDMDGGMFLDSNNCSP
jgi:hypothetical protein